MLNKLNLQATDKALTTRKRCKFPLILRVSTSRSNCCFQDARRASSYTRKYIINIE